MTCVLTSPWQPFGPDSSWSPMNSDSNAATSSLERQSSHGYASSESDAKRPGGSSGKKRASRAGTRSVTTLSAAQLERKRANDREAQRAIRQRTKDHIESLEKTVSELRSVQESNEKVVAATGQRNRELEDEIVYLRSKLEGGGYSSDALQSSIHRQADPVMLSVQSTSPQASVSGSSIQRPSSTSTPRSLSVTTGSTSSRHGSFQQQAPYLSTPSSAITIAEHGVMASTMPLTTWRSHDGTTTTTVQTLPPAQPHAPDASHPHHSSSYHTGPGQERPDWAGSGQQYQYPASSEHQRLQQYETQQAPPPPPPGLQQHYVQPPAQPYTPVPPPPPVPQQQTFHPPQLPQNEFQSMAVSSPAYQVQQHHGYQHTQHQQSYQPPHQSYPPAQQPPAYQQAPPMQMAPVPGGLPSVVEYPASHGHMQPPPLPPTQYHAPPTEQHYAPQAIHPPMQYPNDGRGRSYSLSHYPSG